MGQILDCFCIGIEFTHIGQKKSYSILTTNANQALCMGYITSAA